MEKPSSASAASSPSFLATSGATTRCAACSSARCSSGEAPSANVKRAPSNRPDRVALHRHLAVVADAGEGVVAQVQAAEEGGGAAVDEALHQLGVQGVAEAVLQLAGAALPVGGVAQPVGAVADVGEGAHPGEALGQDVDLAFGAIHGAILLGHPVGGQAPGHANGEVLEQGLGQAQVLVQRGLAEVRRLADLPQLVQAGRVAGALGDVGIVR